MSKPVATVDWTLRELATPSAVASGRPAYGRYRRPIPSVVFPGAPRFRLKEWSYTACTTPTWFFALGLVQLGYVAQLFVYLVDRQTGARAELERIVPLGRGLTFAESSIVGTTRFRARGISVTAGFAGSHFVELDLPLAGKRLSGQFWMEPDDALALLYPLAFERPAYTHKAAGLRCRGSLGWGGRRIVLDEGLGSIDWTRSLANRHTVWNWASFSGHTVSGKRFGLNLSARVYDDAEGHSLENAVWFDGRVEPLGGVQFLVPARTQDRWRVQSVVPGEVDLEFSPWGERRAHLELGIVRSVFVQPYGLVSGTVRGEEVCDVFGVVEDHDALW